MAYWVKINYERSIYLIDLDSITAFSFQGNKRITFWLPNSSQPIILTKQACEDSYRLVLEYIKKKSDILSKKKTNEWWVQIIYDRDEWLINLNSISAFAYEGNGRITFWLPDSTEDIIINNNSNPEAYSKISKFIKQVIGHSLP